VTLVEITGGAARAIGAQMAVLADGSYCGFVSGGCTEAAVAAEAVEAIQKGTDRFLTLGVGSPFIDIVLPCGGGIKLAIHVVRDERPLRAIVSEIGNRRSTTLSYDPGCQKISAAHGPDPSGWKDGCFYKAFRPKLRIVLSGGGVEVEALQKLAEAVNIEVSRIERLTRSPCEELDGDCAVVLLYHDIERETAFLTGALASSAFYIGALGSQATHKKRVEALKRAGLNASDIGRITGPIGLFKTKNSSALAISVLAQIVEAYETSPWQ
jgi:xanthine dehydrogenase accessory factor